MKELEQLGDLKPTHLKVNMSESVFLSHLYANAILETTNNESKIERQTDRQASKQASGGGNSARSLKKN